MAKSFEWYIHANRQDGLRDACAQAFGVYGLLRSDNQRMIMLSEMSACFMEEEGPSPCPAVVTVVREGKTNSKGKVTYAAFMRHKDVFVCPVALLAMYLFDR